jgi:spermidine synthase
MLPWEAIETVAAPGGGTLKLARRGTEMSIRLDGFELMNSRMSGSEEALARLALARIAGRAAPQILIGGLGMGFTLRAAQSIAPADARIVVAELSADVARWARGRMAGLFGDSLADPRVDLRIGDVGEAMAAAAFDAILLDVDNGPDALARPANATLYSPAGLRAGHRSLRPGGVLAIWSAGPDERFTRRLREAGFTVAVETARGGRGRGARHVIWLAGKPG